MGELRRIYRAVSTILIMTLVNQLFPATAFAQPETSVKEFAETVETNDSKEPIEEKAEIIGEIIEKREKNVKHFAMSDSSIKACIYPEAVHYLEEGQYEEIDNSLVESHSENKTYYKNKKNSFTVSFPENYGEDSIRFEDENGYVSFRLLEASNQKLQKLTSYNEKKDSTDVENVNSKVIFPSVRADMDIEYDILGNVLKETIVLNKKTKKSFIFEVQTSAYSAVKNNNNSISFYDDNGTEIYTMDSPFMTDDAGEYSNKVVTELEKTEQGYLLSYTPDYAWLSEKERIYPVRIDPTLVQSVHTSSVLDTYVGNVQTAANNDIRGGWDIMNIGRRIQTVGSSQILARGLIKFDLPQEIGKNDCIVEAKLDLIHRPQEYTSSGTFQYVSNSGTQIDVHELTSAFTEGGTWWGNQPGYNPVIASYGIVNTDNYIGNSGFSYDSYDVTRLVNKWKNGASNYGIMLKLHNEDEWLNSNRQVFYFSKNSRYYGSISKYVEITYRNTTGIESYWNYTMQDFSPYGTAYINNYNGNLVYIHEDTSFYSLINNFTISHVYNVCESDAGVGRYGCGWKLNMVQQLSPISLSGSSNVKYVYIDGDGTRHYFVQTEDGRIADEDGLGYTYADISEGIFVRKITDKDGNMMKFDSSNYLRAIVDPNGNTINLNYTVIPNGEYALTSVTTSSGGNIIFSYDSNGMLTSITDNAGRNTSFTYESGNLRYIQYPDGRRITYDYYGHWMHGIIAPDNSQLRFGNYIETGKIHSTRYLATDGTDGNSLTFLYDYNQTKVTDTLNNVLTYQFDTLGRVSGTYDNKENIYNYTYNATSYGTDIFKNNKTALSSEGSVYVNNYLTNGAFAYGFSGWTPYNPDAMQLAMVTDHSLLTTNTLKIQNTSAVTTCCYQAPLLPERESYTLSAYIKTEQVSSLGRGAAIKAVTSGGRELYSEYLTGTTDVDINEGFTRVTLTFSLENEEILSNIFVGLFDAEGTLYVDSMQLEEGNTANLINLVDNSGFERSSGDYAVPERFETNYTDSYSGSVSSACHEGTKSYKIRGTADESRYVIQRIPLCGKAGDVYTYGGWTKADSVAKREDTYYDVAAHVVYTDGSDDWFWCNLNTQVTDWQFTSDTVITKKDYTAFEVYFAYYNNCNDAYVDAMFLYRDTAQSYTYDTDGNVISTSDYAKQNSTFEYRNNNLSKLLNPDGTGYDYVYDSNHNLKSAFTSEGLQYNLTYDSQGNILSASAENNANSASIVSGRIYRIRSKNSGKYLTAMGTGNTANVDQEAFSLSPGQKWRVTKNTDGSYTLKSMLDENYVLDVENAGSTDGTNLKMCANYFNMAQKFKFSLNEDYTYRILTGITSYRSCVGTSGGSVDNGANVVQMSYVEEDYQHWYFEDVEVPDVTDIPDGVYQIRSRHSGKYMDVRYGTTSSGAVIQQFQSNFADGQKFYIVKRGNSEYYTIAPFRAPELYVAVSSELDANGNKTVKLSDEGITDNTLFKFVYNAKISAYQIVPKSEQSVCVDVPQSSYLNATALILYHKNDFVNQGFLLETVSDRITVKAVCQDNGNFPYTVTDARGNTTTYEYDFSRGVQTAVTDAEGNRTEYSYNAQNDRLESVTTGRSTAGYQYNTDGSIKKITAPSETEYQFQYDVLGRMQGISVGDQMLSHYTYRDPYTSLVSRMDYGNGTYRSYHYDELDRLTGEGLNGTTYRTYTYDKRNNINQVSDGLSGTSTQFSYDLTGRITGIQASDGQNLSYVYDSLNRVSQSKWTLRDLACNTNYIYGDVSVPGQKNGLIYGIKLNGTSEISYEYDTLTRLRTRTLETAVPFVTEYGYTEGDTEGTTTTLVQSVKNGTEVLSYTYDDVGNIVNISKNGIVLESYTYDERNQLKTVTKGNDVWEYTYDKGGNILSVLKNGEAIKSYTYGDSKWKDLLTNYNGETNGDGSLKTYTYDGVGNPLTYRNNMSLTWTAGRQLESITNGADTFSYRYGMDNLRTQKTVNGAITNYYWLNGMLQAQQTGGETLAFLYDEKGSVYGFQMKNDASEEEYYYVFNVQGDVIGIVNRTGIQVVEYTYGVWGELLAVEGTLAETIGQKNPFRYRGYYYDAETGFYYVSSRYYDPEVGRFISADTTEILDVSNDLYDKNLYAYCDNNPVMRKDSGGEVWHLAVGAVVGVSTQFIADVGIGLATGSSFAEVISSLSPVDYASAAIGGAIAASGIGFVGAVVANATLGGATYLANCSYRGVEANSQELIISTAIGGAAGLIGGSGVNGKNMRGVYSCSKQVIYATKSMRKQAMYNAKITTIKKDIIKGSVRTVTSGLFSNVSNFVRKLFTKSKA